MPALQSQGHESSGRQRRGGRRVATSLSEINVVPLVDVMLVLLIVFMVASPMMQRGLDVSLPEARRADPIAAERLFVTIPLSFRSDRIVQVGDAQVLEIFTDCQQPRRIPWRGGALGDEAGWKFKIEIGNTHRTRAFPTVRRTGV